MMWPGSLHIPFQSVRTRLLLARCKVLEDIRRTLLGWAPGFIFSMVEQGDGSATSQTSAQIYLECSKAVYLAEDSKTFGEDIVAQGGDPRQSLWQSKVKGARGVCGGDGMRLRAPGGSPASLKGRWPGQSVPATARAPVCVRALSASGGWHECGAGPRASVALVFCGQKGGVGKGRARNACRPVVGGRGAEGRRGGGLGVWRRLGRRALSLGKPRRDALSTRRRRASRARPACDTYTAAGPSRMHIACLVWTRVSQSHCARHSQCVQYCNRPGTSKDRWIFRRKTRVAKQ